MEFGVGVESELKAEHSDRSMAKLADAVDEASFSVMMALSGFPGTTDRSVRRAEEFRVVDSFAEQIRPSIVHCLKAFHLIVIALMHTAIFPMKSSFGLLFLSALIFSGCSTPTEHLRPVQIAGGKVIGVMFGPQGPVAGKADGYEVTSALTVPVENSKTLIYKFGFSAPPGTKLERVVIDDISDEQSSSMMDETKPWLDENNQWKGETKPYDYKNPLLTWVYTVTPSLRVYRFTITNSAGKKTVMYQLTGYPEFVKAAMRFSWGEKY